MKQQYDQDVGRALYELIKILNEIDLDVKNKDKCGPDEIVVKRGKRKIRVKL